MFELEAPIAEPIDVSIFWIVAIAIAFAALILLAIFAVRKIARLLPKSKKIDIASIDLSDPKEAAYSLSEYADLYAKENPYYEELKKLLVRYKYKKSVPPFDEETLEVIRKFKEHL